MSCNCHFPENVSLSIFYRNPSWLRINKFNLNWITITSICNFLCCIKASVVENVSPLKKMLKFWSGIPEEFCWNSRGKHLEEQRNFDGIPLECRRNTADDFVQIYCMFSRIIQMKYHSFFGGKKRNSYAILVVFWWNFGGIFYNFGGILMKLWWHFDGIS